MCSNLPSPRVSRQIVGLKQRQRDSVVKQHASPAVGSAPSSAIRTFGCPAGLFPRLDELSLWKQTSVLRGQQQPPCSTVPCSFRGNCKRMIEQQEQRRGGRQHLCLPCSQSLEKTARDGQPRNRMAVPFNNNGYDNGVQADFGGSDELIGMIG